MMLWMEDKYTELQTMSPPDEDASVLQQQIEEHTVCACVCMCICVASYPGSSLAEKRGESLEELITCLVMYYAWFYTWFDNRIIAHAISKLT